VEIDTSEIDLLKRPGLHTLRGYIDRELGASDIGGDEEDAGYMLTIRMVSPNLDAEISKNEVDRGDSFVISGEALGNKEVDILIISPTGSSGRGLETGSTIPGCPGVNYYTVPVARRTDDTFSKVVYVDDTAYGGRYAIVVLSRGRDGKYGDPELNKTSIIDAISRYHIQDKTQDQFMAIVGDATFDSVGSDDICCIYALEVRGPEEKIILPRNEVIIRYSSDKVALGDEYKISGECYGSDFVNLVVIAPKGGEGRGMTGKSGFGIYKLPVMHNTFSKKIEVDEDADTGRYVVMVLSPGMNGVYDDIGTDNLIEGVYKKYQYCLPGADDLLKEGEVFYDLREKEQEILVDIIKKVTIDTPGSDDTVLIEMCEIECPYVGIIYSHTYPRNELDDVPLGETLKVTGTTNREDGTPIVVSVKGPIDLPPQTVKAINGTFNAKFDTNGAIIGTYIIKADDGDGNTDECAVNIIAPIPTPTPKVTENPEPTASPTAKPTILKTPVPETSTPESPEPPGFEVISVLIAMGIILLFLHIKKER